MSLLWLRVALVFYGLGLVYALAALGGRGKRMARIVLPAVGTGVVFHFVSLAEAVAANGQFAPATIHQSESVFAFLVLLLFLGMYGRYQTLSPGIFMFPLAFLLTFAAAMGQAPPQFASAALRSSWIAVHVALIFTGYAALALSFTASLLYLLQERSIKSKQADGLMARLPALEVLDDIGFRSLLFGFPFMTLGLLAGSVIAQEQFGAAYLRDPKIVLSLLMWVVYLVLVYTRWNAGWRGRRAAFLSTFAFLVAAGAWAANYFSEVHRFLRP